MFVSERWRRYPNISRYVPPRQKYARKTVRFHRNQIGPIITFYSQKYAQIEPYIMPIIGPQSHSGSHFSRVYPNTHSTTRSAAKSRLYERYNLPDCENKAEYRLFLKGARYGLRLDPGRSNPGSIRARIRAGRIGWIEKEGILQTCSGYPVITIPGIIPEPATTRCFSWPYPDLFFHTPVLPACRQRQRHPLYRIQASGKFSLCNQNIPGTCRDQGCPA